MPDYTLTYNGEALKPEFATIEPGTLEGHIDPSSSSLLEVFRTPIDVEWDLEKVLHEREGQSVSLELGETHATSGRDVEIEAEDGFVYDLFVTALDEKTVRGIAGGGRYAVTGAEGYEVPFMVTFDEARHLAATALGLTADQAEAVRARVKPMTAWGERGRFVIVGFDLDQKSSDTLTNPGVMVHHNGLVNFYHGMSAQQTREAAHI